MTKMTRWQISGLIKLGSSFILIFLALSGCENSDDRSRLQAEIVARKLILAHSYSSPNFKQLDQAQVDQSLAKRRQEAWRSLESVFETAPVPPEFGRGVPAWATWYSFEEISQIVRIFYHEILNEEQRSSFKKSKTHWSRDLAKQALTAYMNKTLPAYWTPERLEEYRRSVSTEGDLPGLSSARQLNASLFNEAFVEHILQNASFIYHCGTADKSCFYEDFGLQAATVKPVFLPLKNGVASLQTNYESLLSFFLTRAWQESTTVAAKAIFRARPTGTTDEYGLVGLHLVTKQLKDWFWMSVWWSDDSLSDFGSDRPLGQNKNLEPYKMCAVSNFRESNRDVVVTTVSEAYRATLDEQSTSWCSNYFIETMPHGHNSNCIGCHQYASTEGIPEFTDDIPRQRLLPGSQGSFIAGFRGGDTDFYSLIKSLSN